MAATIHTLRPQSRPLSGFWRVGHTGQRKLAELHAAGRFPYNRVVFDAAHINEQLELLKTLRTSGCEVILDPNFAEMATIGRFGSSSLRKLPWANGERPWQAGDFGTSRNLDVVKSHDIAKAIAEFAVNARVTTVLAPTHLIESIADGWRPIDLRICEALRYELDRAGGTNIAIDFQLITVGASVKDEATRNSLIADIARMPIENVWLRISGFGATATGAGTRQFVESVRPFHGLGKPIIADMVGGFAGLATLAFGAVGGISHGVCQKENFKATDWKKAPSGGGGASNRAYVPELDRYFKEDQLEALFGAKGGRSRFGCNDTSCCRHGSEDMIENGHAHFLTQRHRQITDPSGVPEARRLDHFLLHHLDPAIRSARLAARLKIDDEKVMAAVVSAKGRVIRLRDALADLNAAEPVHSFSQPPAFRGGAQNISAVLGR